VAAEVCDRIAIIHKGRIATMGTLEEVCASRPLEEVFLRITGTEA
jgi:ABC-type hemin transport system ATPase subunit